MTDPEPVSTSEMKNKRRRTTEPAAESTGETKKGAAVKAAEATRRDKTETFAA